LDAFVAAAVVTVGIGASWRVVYNLNILDAHAEWCSGIVGSTSGPFNGAFTVAWITTSPDPEADSHRSLRESGATLSICVVECTDNGTVDNPFKS